MYGQFITEMENLMIIIVLERQNVKHSLYNFVKNIHSLKSAFDEHNHTFVCILLIIFDII